MEKWCLISCILIILSLLILSLGLAVNYTASAPVGVYVKMPFFSPLYVGQWVGFRFPNATWAVARGYIKAGERGIKKVGALPGEYLLNRDGHVVVCSTKKWDGRCRALGMCQQHDSHGRRMHCQHWEGYRIPQGFYYLSSQRVSNSFDSRYFGLVSRDQILYGLRLVYGFE